jgi:hypothetical protein
MTPIQSAQELLIHGELVDVRYHSLSAVTLDEPRESFESDDVEQTVEVQFGSADRVIEVRANVLVKTRIAEYSVTGVTQFHVEDGVDYSDEAAAEFAEKVGVMAIYPYLREAIQSLTTRLHESPVTMPLMRQSVLVANEADAVLADSQS